MGLDERFLDVHVTAGLERLFSEALMGVRRRADMYNVHAVGPKEILDRCEAGRSGLYPPDLF